MIDPLTRAKTDRIIAFIRHSQGFIGIKCVIRQFLAFQDLSVDMIFEWLEFLVEVQTEKNRKSTTTYRKKPKNTEKKTKKTEKTEKKPNATTNFKFGTGFFRVFLGCNPPPPPYISNEVKIMSNLLRKDFNSKT